jgi:hypothetical protein
VLILCSWERWRGYWTSAQTLCPEANFKGPHESLEVLINHDTEIFPLAHRMMNLEVHSDPEGWSAWSHGSMLYHACKDFRFACKLSCHQRSLHVTDDGYIVYPQAFMSPTIVTCHRRWLHRFTAPASFLFFLRQPQNHKAVTSWWFEYAFSVLLLSCFSVFLV